ncbi:MAG: flagellar hook-associated protein FlgK [Rhodobacterales bacterium]|nr:MAG: flagellar hook-associated protein FlgK [Rhodobacterales bacterium]
MTITSSLSNALSGLTAASRAAELVSSNVANAQTEGYGRREIVLASHRLGGVNVVGVRREVDMTVVQERRQADASVGYNGTIAEFYAGLERSLGTPDEPNSLSGRMAALESALIEAQSRPDNAARLAAVRNAAADLAGKLNMASDAVQNARMRADSAIAAQVKSLGAGLERIQNLNYKIREAEALGQDPSSFMDLRQQTVDEIASIVPLKQANREGGQIALYTPGGAILLDGKAAALGFTGVGMIVPEMSKQSGALSGLSINGTEVRTDGDRSQIHGGSLAALFKLRDELATNAQSRLDAVARDLIERFEAPGVDPTLSPGEPGLFTDAGAALDTSTELGLSSRISLNAMADPSQGGELWRLRDGLGAATQGDVGNTTLLHALNTALTAERAANSGDFSGVFRSASGLAGDLLSRVGMERTAAEGQQAHAVAQQDSLTLMELETGVDTDHEMQKLMLIEQAFAANAKVISTVDAMLQAIMDI